MKSSWVFGAFVVTVTPLVPEHAEKVKACLFEKLVVNQILCSPSMVQAVTLREVAPPQPRWEVELMAGQGFLEICDPTSDRSAFFVSRRYSH